MRFSNIASLCLLVWLATTYVEAGRTCIPRSFGNGGGGNGGGPINPGGPIITASSAQTTAQGTTVPQTTAKTQPNCPQMKCMACNSGYRYNITTGCNTCDCVDPCERTTCNPDQTCQALQPPCAHYCTDYGCSDQYCYKIAQCTPITTTANTPSENSPVEVPEKTSPATGLGPDGPA